MIEVSDTLYKTCKRLVSEGDPRPSESCIASSEPYEPQGDCISREALKSELTRLGWTEENGFKNRYVLDDIIDNVQTVEPGRPKGEWEHDKLFGECAYVCSFCHTIWMSSEIQNMHYCPTCGADMRGSAK